MLLIQVEAVLENSYKKNTQLCQRDWGGNKNIQQETEQVWGLCYMATSRINLHQGKAVCETNLFSQQLNVWAYTANDMQ